MANPNPSPETRFRSGRSGNPGGRPKGRSVTSRLRRLLLSTKDLSGKPIPDGKQLADLVAEVLVKQTLAGEFKFAKLLVERNDSRALEELRERIAILERAAGPGADDGGLPPDPAAGTGPADGPD